MADKIYAVIDTNVIVSAMYTRNPESPTKIILDKIIIGDVTPLYADEIIDEYQEVLSRKQFPFKPENISDVINAIERFGIAPVSAIISGKQSKVRNTPRGLKRPATRP